MSACDKCGQDVPPNNSAARLTEILLENYEGFVPLWRDRHLFPVPGCEGSPSRVKKIEAGDPAFLSAYARLQDLRDVGVRYV